MLAQFPDMGKKQDALLQGLRSFPVKPYIVFYVQIEDGIEILRILHQSRDERKSIWERISCSKLPLHLLSLARRCLLKRKYGSQCTCKNRTVFFLVRRIGNYLY
ncbi:plasmid stabilization system protein [Calothrix sp. NIES-4071]|nr:plasmid stabilization system protein [Calothrix sp. NIES-4071]BAZ61904.1 plasmid stabilization system protein [Calothrix sp. NIES-4105]